MYPSFQWSMVYGRRNKSTLERRKSNHTKLLDFKKGDDFLLVEGIGDTYNDRYNQKSNNILPDKSFQMDGNIPKQDKILGIGFLNAPTGNISYGMRAEYAEDSTSNSPIIKVTIQTGHSEETHYVDINQVNATNATEIEMFALCCYADDTGKGTGGKFGTWQTLNYYRTNASDNDKFNLTKSIDSCLSVRQNWLLMIEQMKKIYIESGLYKQSMDGNLLLECLSSENMQEH